MKFAYLTWSKTNHLLTNLAQLHLNKIEHREVKSIVERALTSSPGWLILDPVILDKMRNEVTENRKIKNIDGGQLYDMFVNAFQFIAIVPKLIPTLENNTFSLPDTDFSITLPTELVRRFMATASVEETITMLLNLTSYGFQGQQWAHPKKWFESIRSKYGLDLIAYGSPVNVVPNVPYGSINLDNADRAFQSVGDFLTFDVREFMRQFAGKTMTITANPPFIETFLANAVTRINEMYDIAADLDIQLTVFFNGPDWNDAEFHQRLTNHQFLRSQHVMGSGEYTYEDCFTGKKIIGMFKSRLFALCNRDDAKFHSMTNGFIIKKTKPSGRHHSPKSKATNLKTCKVCQTKFKPMQHWHNKCKVCSRKK